MINWNRRKKRRIILLVGPTISAWCWNTSKQTEIAMNLCHEHAPNWRDRAWSLGEYYSDNAYERVCMQTTFASIRKWMTSFPKQIASVFLWLVKSNSQISTISCHLKAQWMRIQSWWVENQTKIWRKSFGSIGILLPTSFCQHGHKLKNNCQKFIKSTLLRGKADHVALSARVNIKQRPRLFLTQKWATFNIVSEDHIFKAFTIENTF